MSLRRKQTPEPFFTKVCTLAFRPCESRRPRQLTVRTRANKSSYTSLNPPYPSPRRRTVTRNFANNVAQAATPCHNTKVPPEANAKETDDTRHLATYSRDVARGKDIPTPKYRPAHSPGHTSCIEPPPRNANKGVRGAHESHLVAA